MADKRKNIKQNNIIQLLLGLVIIVLVNIIGSYVFTRIDLTSEKRYSLSDETKELLRDLDDYVFFRVYLEGDFPAGFKRLRNATKEMLDEFRAYTDYIDYEFINPSAADDPKERQSTYQLLVESGLQPTDLQVKTGEGQSSRIIFPGALVTYKAEEIPVELLKTQFGLPSEAQLNNSIQFLEFNLSNTIKKLTQGQKPKVAYMEGHGELGPDETADLMATLAADYAVERIAPEGRLNSLTERIARDTADTRILNKYDAIIIAKPDSTFSEQDKFIIDQFIMRGGKVLWLIDPVLADMDSIQNQESTVGIAKKLKLEDQLFRYGIRLNNDLVLDLNALPIPLVVGQMGDQPQIELFPWYYFPILTPVSDHPIVKNLNVIKTEFVSSIDTIAVPGIKKTILLKTSPYSRTVNTPVFISLRMISEEPDEKLYRGPAQPVAVLLEGEFKSLYQNRIPPEIANDKDIGFLEKSRPTSMVVVSDGDLVKNQFRTGSGYPLPLGYDKYTRRTFGNKEFVMNALAYLIDERGLISIRSKELTIRMLDKTRVSENELFIQIANVSVPIILIIIYGLISNYFRKRKYGRSWK
ncbi:MAG: gliding motility-associated ABC transporter substrate-binding protein GldG [Bacteroidales bacterium]|nr:gliding motility-associated ABC transporter substrate-binding protein GldG [Bacteroidales bacterium]MCF8350325.1 gliding motility-associated ABC transporter substrate-binding protein GldG [Bacteroidales bacterium]MCF8375971.1 gliding motility-associated ABC transporter substrate-binding protein GldG [Bacteroidales bacterium]MCF8400459.1 gliding motility-associated ABC transporter substrate-binding protein GldG [Bacteroidales bacterium]